MLLNIRCNKQLNHTEYKSISHKGFSTIPLVFNLPEKVLDSGLKNIFIRLRNDNEYPYSNIFLIASLNIDGNPILQDTLEYAMAAPDGTWLGKGFREVKESKLWWKEGIEFPKSRPISINISQAVRNNGNTRGIFNLKGIISVGISIENQE